MSRFIHKSHNVSVLLYHVVCVAKYRRVVFDEAVEAVLREVCLEIALRFEIEFLEIGLDGDHVHFLVQSVPTYSPTKIVTTVKSVTAREVFSRCPYVKKKLWGGEFWSDGYFIASVGQQESEETVRNYVKQQGHDNHYRQLHAQASARAIALEIIFVGSSLKLVNGCPSPTMSIRSLALQTCMKFF